MTKNTLSTYDRFFQSLSPKEKREFEREYRELVFSEMLIAIMEKDDISARELAEKAGISPTIVQGLRIGTRKHVSIQIFFEILKDLGCKN